MVDINTTIRQLIKKHRLHSLYFSIFSSLTMGAVNKEIFQSLSMQRKKMAETLQVFPYSANEAPIMSLILEVVFNSWRLFKIALAPSSPFSWLKFCLICERQVLAQCDELVWNKNISEEMFRIFTVHQQVLKQSATYLKAIINNSTCLPGKIMT